MIDIRAHGTQILSPIEQGDYTESKQHLPSVSKELSRLATARLEYEKPSRSLLPSAEKSYFPGECSSMNSQKYLAIVNPHSGKKRGTSVLEQVQSALLPRGIELDIRMTERESHARQIAQETCLEGYAGICAIGGDGTFHEVVSGIMERKQKLSIPVGIIPGGTGNDVARHLGIKGVEDAIGHMLSGEVQPFDVAKVISGDQVDYCTTLVGWNVVAEVNRVAEKLRRLGPPRYALAGLTQVLLSQRRSAKVIFDDHSIEDDFLLVTACNTSFVGSGMRFAPRARTDDGMLDVVVVREASRWQLLRLFRKIFDGSHIEVDCVEYFQTRSLQILADDGQPLDIDGEVKGSTPFSVEVIPAAIFIHVDNRRPTSV
ncbi:Diacylglycerol kinase [Adhaeretor mobilis]|uniref:Diacylglycerol kinase n=2 Tax=Adhaeretor mobilis TaxID=1930276 RepID=A0A517N367_9BACT|nr:Diacylglycerol kinase [Adhaeretor mobilis]